VSWIPYVTMFLLMLVGLFLIFIILLQRGRGGGLAGALGGMGGTSAFGTRAGDVFTKITIVVAIIWTMLAAGNIYALRITTNKFKGGSAAVPTAPAVQEGAAGGTTTGEEQLPPGLGEPKDTKPADEAVKGESETFDGDAAKPTEKPATESTEKSEP